MMEAPTGDRWWFQVVDASTGDDLPGHDAGVVSVRRAADYVVDLRDKIHAQLAAGLTELVSPTQLKIYASREAYDKEKRKRLDPEIPLTQVRQDLKLIVAVPSQPSNKRQKTVWSTPINLDLSKLAPVSARDAFWTIDAAMMAGFGVAYSGEEFVFFQRPEVAELTAFLRDDVLRDGACGYVLGPPGTGKSATTASFALSLARTEWVVTWIHLGRKKTPKCVRIEGKLKKTVALDEYYLRDGDLRMPMDEVDPAKKHVVILDGLTLQHSFEVLQCVNWLERNPENGRLGW